MPQSHQQLRRLFIDHFAARGHTEVPSSPLTPQNDPSLMFVNAGMVQFKDAFLGHEDRSYKRAVSCQKCMRVSGKHNDLEEVGRTARHHTLFEMLGNFSFGDYFKEEAIAFAWEFVTQALNIPKDRLYITVFGGEEGLPRDDEAQDLWRRISDLPPSHIQTRGRADNFWSMGETGPCGPCTEIHVDQGRGPVSLADFENGRVMEIWNIVFMQNNRGADGALTALPRAAVDTGMGLERVLAILNQADSNYHTDIFLPLIDEVAARSGHRYGRSDAENDVSMRVIADHARALTFLVADGVAPSNEGRGYVLRRIVRRAIRHGRRLGLMEPFLGSVCARVAEVMGGAYEQLPQALPLVEKLAEQEEVTFGRTLDAGLKLLGESFKVALGHVAQGAKPVLSGEVAFKLYDTFGFPKDLTETIALERGIHVDHEGFDALMQQQQDRSRTATTTSVDGHQALWRDIQSAAGPSSFVGYPQENISPSERSGVWRQTGDRLEAECRIKALVGVGNDTLGPRRLDHAIPGQVVDIVLDPMPLYGEGGGQVGDTGYLTNASGLVARVTDTWRPLSELMVARVEIETGELRIDDTVWAGYSAQRRQNTRAHHSATHLLHGALRSVLGSHVRQAGSLVAPTHLRFDFTHFNALSAQELLAVEDHINLRIARKAPILTQELSFEAAQAQGAMALFGEKYGEHVRVISMDDSIELCGGTHAANTSDLKVLLLNKDQAVKAGVRRLEAHVADAALGRLAHWRGALAAIAELFGAPELASSLASESQRAAADENAETSHILALVRRSYAQTIKNLTSLGDGTGSVALNAQGLGITQSNLSASDGPVSLHQARQIRATWFAIAAMVQGRTSDGINVLNELGQDDIAHLAAATLAALTAERESERECQEQERQAQREGAKSLVAQMRQVGDYRLLAQILGANEAKDLKALADDLRQSIGSGVVCLFQVREERVTLLIALTPDLTSHLSAGQLVAQLAPDIGGKGGGRKDLAQAGGRDPEGISRAIQRLEALLVAKAP